MGQFLILLAALLGIAENARSEFGMDRPQLIEALESAKEVLHEIPADAAYALRIELGLISAFAFSEAYDCFYAGWPSQMTSSEGKRYCSRPTSFPHYSKYTKDAKGLPFACLSTPNTMACNPLFFGKGADDGNGNKPGLCANIATSTDRQTAFSQCESQAAKLGARKYDFVDDVLKDPEASAELLQTLDWVRAVCIEGSVAGKPSTQKGTQMCAKFVAKLKIIEPKLSKVALQSRNDPQPLKNTEPSKPKASEPKTFAEMLAASNGRPPANKECKDCNEKRQQNVLPTEPRTFSELLQLSSSSSPQGQPCKNWLTDGGSDQACYDQLKSKFFNSGKCHRWERLPESGKTAFKLGLFANEIRAFREVITPPTAMTEAGAIDSLASAFGWSAAIKKEWSDRAAALPRKGNVTFDSARVRFQADLTKQMRATFDSAIAKAEIKRRAAVLLQKSGVSDCDFPSKEAFVAAVSNIRRSGVKAAKPDILTVADRSLGKKQERVTTFDLNKGEVLFQTDASFGDADPAKLGPEADFCSNNDGSNATPHGVSLTIGGTRAARSGAFRYGMFIEAPNTENTALTSSRGIAFHESGGHVFGNFADTAKTGPLMKKAIDGGSIASMTLLLRRISSGLPEGYGPGNTDGCVGIPPQSIHTLNSIIQGGSYVYFHCPKIRK